MTLKLVLDHFELSPCYHQFTHAWGIGHHCHMTNIVNRKNKTKMLVRVKKANIRLPCPSELFDISCICHKAFWCSFTL